VSVHAGDTTGRVHHHWGNPMVKKRSPRPLRPVPRPHRNTPESARAAHVARCIRVHGMLRTSGRTVYKLADELGVGVNTVRRDIRTLEEAGHPIEEAGFRGQAKVWRLVDRSRGLHRVAFATKEALDVYIALVRCRVLVPTGLMDGLESALAKIEATLDSDEVRAVRGLAKKFYDRGEDAIAYTDKDRDNADAIVRALQYDERLTLTTLRVKDGVPVTRAHFVEPLTLGFYQNGVYLAARYVGKSQRVYRFALDNLEDATVHQGDRFPYPADWQPAGWFGRGFGIVAPKDDDALVRVRVRFTGDAAYLRRVRRRILPVEGGWEEPGGEGDGAVLWMRVGEKDFEVANWLVRFAGNVEVLEPASLRADLARRGERLHHQNRAERP
jgi:predicted DNA-binding transcriptional regulator YafY